MRELRGALHEEHDAVALDEVVDALLNVAHDASPNAGNDGREYTAKLAAAAAPAMPRERLRTCSETPSCSTGDRRRSRTTSSRLWCRRTARPRRTAAPGRLATRPRSAVKPQPPLRRQAGEAEAQVGHVLLGRGRRRVRAAAAAPDSRRCRRESQPPAPRRRQPGPCGADHRPPVARRPPRCPSAGAS